MWNVDCVSSSASDSFGDYEVNNLHKNQSLAAFSQNSVTIVLQKLI